MVKKYCYFNGKIQPVVKTGLSLSDLGVLRGYGVFDFLRTYNRKPFYFKDHFFRFKKSAKLLGLKVPISSDECLDVLNELLIKNNLAEASFRLVLTGGESVDGLSPGSKNTFFILVEDIYELPKNVFIKGSKLITCSHKRLFPESKNLNYITAVMLQTKKKKAGAIEVLYVDDGFISEATTSNIFMIKQGVLYTTKKEILQGITRKIVIKLAKKILPVIEKDISLNELFEADECFITATNKKIVPIINIDGKKISNGKPGVITKELMKLLDDLILNY